MTGYTLNNIERGPGGDPLPQQWRRTSIGTTGTYRNWYNAAGDRVTQYGEMVPRKLAPHETGAPVGTLRVETSGQSPPPRRSSFCSSPLARPPFFFGRCG